MNLNIWQRFYITYPPVQNFVSLQSVWQAEILLIISFSPFNISCGRLHMSHALKIGFDAFAKSINPDQMLQSTKD